MRERSTGGYDPAKLPAIENYITRNMAKQEIARTLTSDWWWWW